MNKAQREQKIRDSLVKIRNDFRKMQGLLDLSPTIGAQALGSRAYLERQIQKYLKPFNNKDFMDKVAVLLVALQPPLLNAARDEGSMPIEKPNWDTEGVGGVGNEHVSWKLELGGGWAGLRRNAGRKIRINQKAFWMFPELTLRGVMVHEATHFALDTEDICYSTFTRNSVMKELEYGSDNADNWRIFYQKMSTHFATGLTE